MFSEADHGFMTRALALARQGLFTTTPNPSVGCVIVKAGVIVGEGWHRRAGEAHAELVALAEAGARARGATVYLTLEPCSHFGRTPPCVDALIDARVGRVITAMEDPNPRVLGQGLERLRAAGIDVRCGLLRDAAIELNRGFVARMTRGRPWVRLKVAASLDGLTALPDGRSQWITSEAARQDGHAWRARACAVLTGIGTVMDDDPALSVRDIETSRQPLKVVVDSKLRIDFGAKVLHGAPTWLVCAHENPAKAQELRDRGCEVLHCPNALGRVDLAWMLQELAERGLNEVHVEAGATLGGALIRAGLVDEVLAYLAPCLLGQGLPMFRLEPPDSLEHAVRWQLHELDRVGSDVRVLMRF